MSFPGLATAIGLVERGWVPDGVVRSGIRAVIRSGLRERGRYGGTEQQEAHRRLLAEMAAAPIALNADAANAQHYEVPAAFFGLVLGPHRKYSGCYWPEGVNHLGEAEAASLRVTCEHAELQDGQDILELGCGWGSLSLWMAENYPQSHITAVSNSHSQRTFIEEQCRIRNLTNLRVITADINDFDTDDRFDRIVSVEMFEHMRNYERLMGRIADWLREDGKLFVHIFVHGRCAYLFETVGPANWLGRYFFTGGMMPADDLLPRFQRDLLLEHQWRQDGTHYRKTAEAWLANLDAQRSAVLELFERVYGPHEKQRWMRRWRVFFLSCAELFGYADGMEWWVSHYRFVKRHRPATADGGPHETVRP
ncbi:MAG: class I SAM-dependent methyltransferase [Phycisphaerae bacterium]|nr:class I SAM-dependent methyltransferase [Phycisphaerae bacterium]